MPPRDPEAPAPDGPEPGADVAAHTDEGRGLHESRLQADPARLADGWERRFVIEGARVADYVQLYESLGFEVAADPVRAEEVLDDCTDCRIVALLQFRMIYTRAKRPSAPGASHSRESPR